MSQEQWDQLRATILARGQAAIDAALRECDDLGDEILAESKKLCPVSPSNKYIDGAVDENGKELKGKKRPLNPHHAANRKKEPGYSGKLRDSGTTEQAELVDGQIVKRIFDSTDYTAAVHERTGALHGSSVATRNLVLRATRVLSDSMSNASPGRAPMSAIRVLNSPRLWAVAREASEPIADDANADTVPTNTTQPATPSSKEAAAGG